MYCRPPSRIRRALELFYRVSAVGELLGVFVVLLR